MMPYTITSTVSLFLVLSFKRGGGGGGGEEERVQFQIQNFMV